MNVVFISTAQYPNGGAAANRHMAYAKGLLEAGHDVSFVLLSEQKQPYQEYSNDGIKYYCAFPKPPKNNKGKLGILITQVRYISAAKREILKIHKNSKIGALVLLNTYILELIPLIWMAKINSIKVLHERTEYPFVSVRKKMIDRIELYIYTSYVLRKFNGIYVISNSLKIYFDKILDNKIPTKVINMVVDPNRFKTIETETKDIYRYITYCGTINDEKDGVDILVKAFGSALRSNKLASDVKLILIGNYIDEIFKVRLNKIIDDEKCRNNILFTGDVETNKIPGLLNNASALVLARPKSLQAEGGFPTKLGEYLATGKPVIITNVGEINLFLRDGYNAFIAEPGDVNSFAEKIIEVFSDYTKALVIGQQGKALVEKEFNYYHQAVELAHFIESL